MVGSFLMMNVSFILIHAIEKVRTLYCLLDLSLLNGMNKYTSGSQLKFRHLCCQRSSCYLKKLFSRFCFGRHVEAKHR